jgi:superfamily II DNA or RNA helicase
MGEIGGCFGLLIFDEVHHLIAPEWAEIGRLAIAPFRLGLTATYDPRKSEVLNELVGPLAYWKPVRELSGTRLAHYEVVRLSVDLSPDERREYERQEIVYQEYWRERPDVQPSERKSENKQRWQSHRQSTLAPNVSLQLSQNSKGLEISVNWTCARRRGRHLNSVHPKPVSVCGYSSSINTDAAGHLSKG